MNLVQAFPRVCTYNPWTLQAGEVASKGLEGAAPDNVVMLRVPWLEVRQAVASVRSLERGCQPAACASAPHSLRPP